MMFPLLGLLVSVSVGRWLPQELMLGFFYLCVLPSTVSSSIAMTAMARGNIAGAVFNATLSSLIGMVLTPLYVGLYMTAEHHGRSEERRVGKECVSTLRSGWASLY